MEVGGNGSMQKGSKMNDHSPLVAEEEKEEEEELHPLPDRGDTLPVYNTPDSADKIQLMQKTRLFRFVLLCCDDPIILDHYVKYAVQCLQDSSPAMPKTFLAWCRSVICGTDVNVKVYVILAAINQTQAMYDFIRQWSRSEHQPLLDFFLNRVLKTEFRRMCEKKDAQNKVSNKPEDVMYPSIDHFVCGVRTQAVRLL